MYKHTLHVCTQNLCNSCFLLGNFYNTDLILVQRFLLHLHQNFDSFPELYFQSCKAALLKYFPTVTFLLLSEFGFVTETNLR